MSIDKIYLPPEVFNAWINDNRTFKRRLKDTKKLLKKMIKCLERK